MKHFKGFGSGFIKLHAKLDAHMLLHFAIHCRQNKTQIRKSICVKTMRVDRTVSRGRLMQWAFGSVALASPLFFFHRRSYNNIRQGTFWYNLIQFNKRRTLLLNFNIIGHLQSTCLLAVYPLVSKLGVRLARIFCIHFACWSTWKNKRCSRMSLVLFLYPFICQNRGLKQKYKLTEHKN
jgi:hypothetical protein